MARVIKNTSQLSAGGSRGDRGISQVAAAGGGAAAAEDGGEGRRQVVSRAVSAANALKVMMVWVSWMPGMVCTFSLTK